MPNSANSSAPFATEHLHARLGRDVGGTGVHRHMRVQRGDVDDTSTAAGGTGALAHHLPRLVLHAQENAFQAQIDGEIPVCLRQVDDVAGPRPAGHVECDVHAAESVNRRRHQLLGRRLLRHIASDADEIGAEAQRFDRPQVAADDFCALRQQPLGDRQPDTRSGAGHHGNLPGKSIAHRIHPSCPPRINGFATRSWLRSRFPAAEREWKSRPGSRWRLAGCNGM